MTQERLRLNPHQRKAAGVKKREKQELAFCNTCQRYRMARVTNIGPLCTVCGAMIGHSLEEVNHGKH